MKRIDFLSPKFDTKDVSAAVKVLKTGWLTAWNPIVAQTENEFARYMGMKHSVFISSGTAALHVALMALGIGAGDEVITTPLSWVASSNAILYVGAQPIFVDVNPLTGLIDENKVEKAVTKKTKAILPVHLYGQMADMKKLKKIADKHKLFIIEDACHAIESKRDGVRPGQLSDIVCFSFHAAKNITSGEGGAIATNDDVLAHAMRIAADSGVEKGGGKRLMVRFGYKYSITAFQVALLTNQIKRIKKIHGSREKVFRIYRKLLAGHELSGIRLVKEVSGTHARHIFAVLVPPHKRDEIRAELSRRGIITDVHFNPIHLEPYYHKTFKFKKGSYPHAEAFGYAEISLPAYPSLSINEQKRVARELVDVVKTI